MCQRRRRGRRRGASNGWKCCDTAPPACQIDSPVHTVTWVAALMLLYLAIRQDPSAAGRFRIRPPPSAGAALLAEHSVIRVSTVFAPALVSYPRQESRHRPAFWTCVADATVMGGAGVGVELWRIASPPLQDAARTPTTAGVSTSATDTQTALPNMTCRTAPA